MSIKNLSIESTVELVTNQSHRSGKNVLRRNKYTCEDTVPHKVLKILADSVANCGQKIGDDAYNSGRLDTAKLGRLAPENRHGSDEWLFLGAINYLITIWRCI